MKICWNIVLQPVVRWLLLHTTVAMLPHNNGVLMVKCLCKFHSLSNSSRAVLSTRHEQLPFKHYLRLAEKPPHTIYIAIEKRNGHFSSLLSIPTNRQKTSLQISQNISQKNNNVNVKWHYRISWIRFFVSCSLRFSGKRFLRRA